jgi:UDP:flavonoid glycosyltransferase YjiC (YdhE family)
MSDRMRLLFTASPAYGHLLPLLPMVRAAMTAGHDVRLATGPDMVGPMRSRSVPAYGVGPTWGEIVAERDEEARRSTADDLDTQRAISAGVLFGRAAARRLPGLLDMAGRWRPDVVVHEPLELGGVMLARHLGLPSVTHGYGPMFREYGALGPIVAGATGDPGVWDEMLAGTTLDICPPALREPGEALWPDALDLRPSTGEAGGREVFDPGPARALRRPLVYVTLGTISNAIPGLMAEMVGALRSLSVDLVVTTGPGVDPASLGPQPRHVTVRQFVPQEQVLRHADLMVSHAGAGTMLGALCHGLPQLCLPHGADQPWNAEAVARARVGIVVPEEECTPESVRAGVVTLLSSPSYRAAAREVQLEIEAMPVARDVLPRMLELAVADREADELAG